MTGGFSQDDVPVNGTNLTLAEGENCIYTGECQDIDGYSKQCDGTCQYRDTGDDDTPISIEPFCILWSKDGNGFIDTFAFAPLVAWPPIVVTALSSIVPYCTPIGTACTWCEAYSGFPLPEFNIAGVPMKPTMQFRGVGISGAGKLAFGENSATEDLEVWDGFRSVGLPAIPDMNFWLSLRLVVQDKACK